MCSTIHKEVKTSCSCPVQWHSAAWSCKNVVMGEAEREQQQPGHREVCSDRADRDRANFKLSLCLCSRCRAQAGTESRKHQAAGDKGMFASWAVANLQREDLCEDIRYIFRVWGDLFDSCLAVSRPCRSSACHRQHLGFSAALSAELVSPVFLEMKCVLTNKHQYMNMDG